MKRLVYSVCTAALGQTHRRNTESSAPPAGIACEVSCPRTQYLRWVEWWFEKATLPVATATGSINSQTNASRYLKMDSTQFYRQVQSQLR